MICYVQLEMQVNWEHNSPLVVKKAKHCKNVLAW